MNLHVIYVVITDHEVPIPRKFKISSSKTIKLPLLLLAGVVDGDSFRLTPATTVQNNRKLSQVGLVSTKPIKEEF